MKYHITSTWNGSNDSFSLAEDGIYYVAYGDGGVRCFRKPTREQHVIVIASRGCCFAVSGGEAVSMGVDEEVSLGALTLRLLPEAGGLQGFYDRAEEVRKRFGLSRKKVAAAAGVLVLLVAISAFYLGRDSSVRIDDLSDTAVSNNEGNERGRALADMRLKLAEKALKQGRHEKALGLLEKVLSFYPQDASALALRERALKEKETKRAVTQEQIALEMWSKKLLGEAGELISTGDLVGARFKLSQVLNRNPKHAEALEMLAKIDEKGREEAQQHQNRRELSQERVEQAQGHFARARTYAAKEEWRKAYAELKQARSLLQESGEHPDFEIDFNDLYGDVEGRMAKEASDLRARAEESIRKASGTRGAGQQAKLYRLALQNMDEIREFYEVMDVSIMRKQAMEGLNELLKPLYVEAITLQELEGCCYAEAKLKHIRDLAHYPEVEYNRMAAEAMNRCPCKR